MTTEQQLEASVELAGQGVTGEEMAAARKLWDAAQVVAAVMASVSEGSQLCLGASYGVGIIRAFAQLTGSAIRTQPHFERFTGTTLIIESTTAQVGRVYVHIQGTRPMTEADLPRIVARVQQ